MIRIQGTQITDPGKRVCPVIEAGRYSLRRLDRNSRPFPEAGFKFLRQLKLHNDRDWFRERKAEYLQSVKEPMKALVLAVADGCRAQGLPLHAKEKSPVMRVYRDIRFSKDKSPFKTHVAAELRRSFSDSEGLLYIHLSPEESFLAAGVWQPERTLLQSWRETIVKEPDRFARVQASLTAEGLALSRQYTLTKLPRGFQQYADEPFASSLKITSFVVSRPVERTKAIAPKFARTVIEFALVVKPLLEFAWLVEETHAKTKRKKIREEELI